MNLNQIKTLTFCLSLCLFHILFFCCTTQIPNTQISYNGSDLAEIDMDTLTEVDSEEDILSPPCSAPRSLWVRRCGETLMKQGQRYINDPKFRRKVLEVSLVMPSNGYSQLRLMKYTENEWGALPVRWPRVIPMKTECELTSNESKCWFTPPSDFLFQAGVKSANDKGMSLSPQDKILMPSKINLWKAWGAWAFRAYPSQVLSEGWSRSFNPISAGLSVYQGETIGLVWASMVELTNDDRKQLKRGPIDFNAKQRIQKSLSSITEFTSPEVPKLSLTCAACHASLKLPDAPLRPIKSVKLFMGHSDADQFEEAYIAWGLNNPWFDLREAIKRLESTSNQSNTWGPGRADVTNDRLMNPTVYGDLRPISMQSHLHRAGTVINHPLSLAIRIETLLITSFKQHARPPRWLCWALALYLWDLVAEIESQDAESQDAESQDAESQDAESQDAESQDAESQETNLQHNQDVDQGNRIFERLCAYCHMNEGLSGLPVPLSALGDPSKINELEVVESMDRGTGHWRVPSLWGVHQRVWLLSQGQVYGLSALLKRMSEVKEDEEEEDIINRSKGAHAFPFSLNAEQSIFLSRYLKSIGPRK
jgi:mono/diheme cytochrome c family protein